MINKTNDIVKALEGRIEQLHPMPPDQVVSDFTNEKATGFFRSLEQYGKQGFLKSLALFMVRQSQKNLPANAANQSEQALISNLNSLYQGFETLSSAWNPVSKIAAGMQGLYMLDAVPNSALAWLKDPLIDKTSDAAQEFIKSMFIYAKMAATALQLDPSYADKMKMAGKELKDVLNTMDDVVSECQKRLIIPVKPFDDVLSSSTDGEDRSVSPTASLSGSSSSLSSTSELTLEDVSPSPVASIKDNAALRNRSEQKPQPKLSKLEQYSKMFSDCAQSNVFQNFANMQQITDFDFLDALPEEEREMWYGRLYGISEDDIPDETMKKDFLALLRDEIAKEEALLRARDIIKGDIFNNIDILIKSLDASQNAQLIDALENSKENIANLLQDNPYTDLTKFEALVIKMQAEQNPSLAEVMKRVTQITRILEELKEQPTAQSSSTFGLS